jgi:hypothetical protein
MIMILSDAFVMFKNTRKSSVPVLILAIFLGRIHTKRQAAIDNAGTAKAGTGNAGEMDTRAPQERALATPMRHVLGRRDSGHWQRRWDTRARAPRQRALATAMGHARSGSATASTGNTDAAGARAPLQRALATPMRHVLGRRDSGHWQRRCGTCSGAATAGTGNADVAGARAPRQRALATPMGHARSGTVTAGTGNVDAAGARAPLQRALATPMRHVLGRRDSGHWQRRICEQRKTIFIGFFDRRKNQ